MPWPRRRSAAFAVTFAGNQIIGPLMDRIGRKRACQLTLLAAGVTSGLTAFVAARARPAPRNNQ